MTPSDVRKVLESKDVTDRLAHIFAIQGAFANLCFSNNGIRGPEGEILDCDRVSKDAVEMKHGYNDLLVRWTWEMHGALEDELREIEDLLPWKHWSKAQMGEKEHPECTPEERLNHLRLELIDVIHFIVEALIFTGLSSEDVYQLYLKKNLVNIERQEKAYNTANKTEDDNDAIAASFEKGEEQDGS